MTQKPMCADIQWAHTCSFKPERCIPLRPLREQGIIMSKSIIGAIYAEVKLGIMNYTDEIGTGKRVAKTLNINHQ